MNPVHTMRVARSTDKLSAIAGMYEQGLGLSMLAEFANHDGFDGVILGHRRHPYHLEFTSQRGHHIGTVTTADHLLVFYIADKSEWEHACDRMLAAGFRSVRSYNPYWDAHGKTFEDLDGFRVVIENVAWTK
jgi:YycE-like C-terminal domain/YycE-like N-terminal domain